MLKFIFWSLLLINAALFAYSQGYLGKFKGGEHEPARLKNQANAEQIKLIPATQAVDMAAGAAHASASAPASASASASAAASASASATAKSAPASASGKGQPIACLEIGSFNKTDFKRFEPLVAALALGDRQSRHNVMGQDPLTHIVFIPSLGSKEAAEKKASELRALGVTNFFVITEGTAMRWAISLGVFKSEEAAQALLAELVKQGVRSARVAERGKGTKKMVVYQFRNIDSDVKASLEKIKADFPNQDFADCK